MADLGDLASELEGEHLARALERARVAVPAGVAGICDACGDDSPRLVGGRCAPCRDGRNRLAVRREGVRDAAAQPAPAPRRQWIGTAPAAPQEQEVIVAADAGGERTRQVNMRLGGAALAAIEAGVETHGTLGASALALIEAGMGGGMGTPPPEAAPGPVDLTALHIDALLDELKGRFERASDADALERYAEGLSEKLAAATARADAAEAAHAALREKLAAVLG